MTPVIDVEGSQPLKFQVVADGLRRGVLAGTWAVGDRLPTEQQLVQSTSFSLNTVRRAIDVLVAERYVERRQGAGTFVLQRTPAVRRRQTVGVMLPDISEYYPRVLQGVEQALAQAGTGLQLVSYGYERAREDDCIQQLLEARVDGLLLVPTLTELADPRQRVKELTTLNVPTVLLERSLSALGPADDSEYVCSDHEGGGYDAVRHLHRLGHRRIALLLRARSATAAGVHSGYQKAMSDLERPVGPVCEAERQHWVLSRADVMLEAVLDAGATAAVVFGDREATLLSGAAKRRGLSVPGDLALVSYDNETADIAEIPLTAVSPPKHRIGRLAAQILMQRINEGAESPLHQIRVRPQLVIRDSCGAARASGA